MIKMMIENDLKMVQEEIDAGIRAEAVGLQALESDGCMPGAGRPTRSISACSSSAGRRPAGRMIPASSLKLQSSISLHRADAQQAAGEKRGILPDLSSPSLGAS